MSAVPTQPLAGIRVLDLSAMMAGPYCGRWLADLGAEVIKIEPPGGDHIRTRAPLREGCSALFGHLNSGKRFVSLDLKHPEAKQIVLDLAKQADVLIESNRPGVMRRLGLDAPALTEINPRLIYCSVSGFGQRGSAASRPAYAPVVHAASGYYMANFDYQDGAERPANSGIPMADMLTAIFAAMAIQTALFDRVRTGNGNVIDVNLMDSIVNVMAYEFQAAQFPLPNRRPLYKPLRSNDGFVLVAPVNARNFDNLCMAAGHPEWRDDPLLASNQARYDNWDYFMQRIEAWTLERTGAECEAVLMGAGVPCSRYRRLDEVMDDPQFVERSSFTPIEDDAGEYLTTNLPFALAGVKPIAGRRVGAIGSDTAAVLGSMLSMNREQLLRLAREGALVMDDATRGPQQPESVQPD
jgi:CoA:oxalate CoA-transferase